MAATRAVLRSDDVEAAMKRALRLLAVRARSCKEMRDRLAGAGFEPATVDAVEARLLSAGLLDDSAFAAQVVRRGAETGRSARLTRQDLQRFGVTGDVADTSLTELDLAGSDEERALVLAERKAASCRNVATDRAVARVVRHLCSKGYGPQLAWEVTRKVFRDREFPDD